MAAADPGGADPGVRGLPALRAHRARRGIVTHASCAPRSGSATGQESSRRRRSRATCQRCSPSMVASQRPVGLAATGQRQLWARHRRLRRRHPRDDAHHLGGDDLRPHRVLHHARGTSSPRRCSRRWPTRPSAASRSSCSSTTSAPAASRDTQDAHPAARRPRSTGTPCCRSCRCRGGCAARTSATTASSLVVDGTDRLHRIAEPHRTGLQQAEEPRLGRQWVE